MSYLFSICFICCLWVELLIAQDVLFVATCSGKSGSSTLIHSFKALGIESWRAHHLIHHRMLQPKADFSIFPEELSHYAETILFIDSYRDIISRKISSFFQNIHKHLGVSRDEILAIYQEQGVKFFLEQLDQRIIKLPQYYSAKYWTQYGYDYLEDEVFSFENRYQLKQIGNLYFINLRYADIASWADIIQSIPLPIDLSEFKVLSQNIAADKWYASIYRDVLDQFTISQKDFDTILKLNRREIIHFYGDQGVEDFIKRWKPRVRSL